MSFQRSQEIPSFCVQVEGTSKQKRSLIFFNHALSLPLGDHSSTAHNEVILPSPHLVPGSAVALPAGSLAGSVGQAAQQYSSQAYLMIQ